MTAPCLVQSAASHKRRFSCLTPDPRAIILDPQNPSPSIQNARHSNLAAGMARGIFDQRAEQLSKVIH